MRFRRDGIEQDDEDVHIVNERRLTDIIGDVGRKLPTGRSRNDQVAVDMKVCVKKAIEEIVKSLLKVVVRKALRQCHNTGPARVRAFKRNFKILASSISSIQSLASLSWIFPAFSDCERLKQLFDRVDVMPLGSGALGGNPLNIDREQMAKILSFKSATRNSMNAVSDRDSVGEIAKSKRQHNTQGFLFSRIQLCLDFDFNSSHSIVWIFNSV